MAVNNIPLIFFIYRGLNIIFFKRKFHMINERFLDDCSLFYKPGFVDHMHSHIGDNLIKSKVKIKQIQLKDYGH